MSIKTWQERLGNSPHVQASGAVGEAMQAEIDELREACAKLCESINPICYDTAGYSDCASSIRARSNRD